MDRDGFIIVNLIMGLTTAIVAVIGAFMYFKPPTYRNEFYGYRSKTAFRSEEAWFFAQKFSGKYIFVIMTVFTVIRGYLFFSNIWNDILEVVLFFVLIFLPIVVIIVTEKKLKSNKFRVNDKR